MNALSLRVARLAAAVLASLAVGCGGSVFTSGDTGGGDGGGGGSSSGGGDGGGSHDAGPGPSDGGGGGHDAPSGNDSGPGWSPVCPATIPTIGSTCTQETVQCEYGKAWWNVSCDQVVQCDNGRWAGYQATFEPCTPEPGPNSSACPADFAAVQQGSACTDTSLSCQYSQGTCACQVPLGGPILLDGGGGSWGCTPEPGCPVPRPRLGSACSLEGTTCTYEECAYGQTCINGTWQSQPEGCAEAAGGG